MRHSIKMLALFAALLTFAACADQFDEDAGKMTFASQPKLGAWRSLGNDTIDFDVQFYLLVNKDGDTINATVYIDPATNRLDHARVGGSIDYNARTGVVDVLYANSPWDYTFKMMYGATTTLQRISIAERHDGRFGLQTAIHAVLPGYETPPVAALFTNTTDYCRTATPLGQWEDTNEYYSTFNAVFHPNGKVEVVTPWGDDEGTYTFDEKTGTGEMTLQAESAPLPFAYNENMQLAVTYEDEDYALCPVEFYSN